MGRIITDKLISSLNKICPNRVKTNQYLSDISSWRIGGIADCIVEPAGVEELQSVIKLAREEKIPMVVFGATTNLLFADEGLRALGICIGKHMSQVMIRGNTVVAQAGAWVPLLARKVGNAGLAGCEHIVGIPGTIGGLVYMNGGSKRKNIGANVQSVTVIGFDGKVFEMTCLECKFSYRSSVFQQETTQKIIAKVTMQFNERGNPSEIRRRMLDILAERRKKFPKEHPNCGSVFLSDPKVYQQYGAPGSVIEECGLKGLRMGGAEVSTKHANFIVNKGKATSENVLELIKIIRKVVFNKTGFLLSPEVRFIDQYGEIRSLQNL